MSHWKPRMQQAVRHLADQLKSIRSGTVDAGVVDSVRVAVGGNLVPLKKLAGVRHQGDRLLVTPFDPVNVVAVAKALSDARLSAYAMNPTTVSVSIPPLSGEQRQEIAKRVKAMGEEARVAVRSLRQQARKEIDASGRGSFRFVQEATDAAVEEIDRLVKAKVEELSR